MMKSIYAVITVVILLGMAAGGLRSEADDAPPTGGLFRFRDVTAEAGLERYVRGALNHAVAWGDFDPATRRGSRSSPATKASGIWPARKSPGPTGRCRSAAGTSGTRCRSPSVTTSRRT